MDAWLCWAAGLVLLPASACSSDGRDADDDALPLRLAVTEEPWQDEQVGVTRSGETLTALQGSGFGLYSTEFGLSNQQVTWESSSSAWYYQDMKFWPKGVNTASFYAYAPYNGSISVSENVLTFDVGTADNTTDLLWACCTDLARTVGTATLNFQHALAKVSFGTITNKSGLAMTVKSLTVSGEFYKSGSLSLATGGWSDVTNFTSASQTVTRNFADPYLSVADGGSGNISSWKSFMMIPKADLLLTFTMTYESVTEHTLTFSTTQTFEAGKNYVFNFIITNNFEVIIDD